MKRRWIFNLAALILLSGLPFTGVPFTGLLFNALPFDSNSLSFTATVYAGPRLDLITNAEFTPIFPTGITGISGINGINGINGTNGYNGVNGNNSSNSSNGYNSSNGSNSSNGYNGSNSAAGSGSTAGSGNSVGSGSAAGFGNSTGLSGSAGAVVPSDYIVPIAPAERVATEWSPFMVKEKTIAKREEGLDMKGVVPELTEIFGPAYTTINEAIDKTVTAKITAAKEARAKSIALSYTIYHSDELVSIVLYDTVKSASSKESVASVNFRPDSGEIVGLADAVGLNLIPLAEKLLSEKIRRNPDQYNATFDTLSAEQPFYLTNNRVVLLFNEFQLTVSAEGVSTLEMLLSRIDYVVVNSNSTGYYTKPGYYNLKMVQLRQVCNGLGYEVDWNPGEQRVDVYQDGILIIELTIGVNNYQVREKVRSLEAAPEIVRDIAYVPISFFDQILSLVAYSVDDRDNITFISYRDAE